ncbi:MAG: SBBP repeat-containing protein, partial [Bdellovibrionota bacterium]
NVVWISQLGNTTMGAASAGSETARGIAFDSNGDLILTGETSGNLGETNAGSNDAFIAKLNKSNGAVSWVKQLGNTTIGAAANASDHGYDVALDSSDNIYVTGITTGSLGETNGGSVDAFIAKFDSSGTSLWIKQLGNTTMGANASASDYANAIVLSNTGEIYITGETKGNLGESNAGFRDSYVSKFDTSGNLVWVKQLGSVTSANAAGNDYSADIAVGADLNFYITGKTFSSYEIFNNSSTASNTSDGYFAVFDANGNLN